MVMDMDIHPVIKKRLKKKSDYMMDMHTHILPGVDDGAKTFEEALKMLQLQYEQGIHKVVLTPHVQNKVQRVSSKEYLDRFKMFEKDVSNIMPDIKLYLGAEVLYDPFKKTNYDAYVFKGFSKKYLLIEFSTVIEDPITDVLYDLVAKGYQPIVAHIERYPYLTDDDVRRIKDDGSYIQVNSGAVLGTDGRHYKKRAHHYLKLGLVDFIGSDCHDTKSRKPNVFKALKKAPKNFKMRELEE